jgi:hypothetical protein
VQEIKVQVIGLEPPQAVPTSLDGALPSGIVRVDFAHEKNLCAATRNRLSYDFFRTAFGVHFGGVDESHPEI